MSTQTVRPPAVAGLFYPGEPSALAGQIGRLLENAEDLIAAPKALIVPHAGYIYSGPVAASAMAQLRPHRGTIKRVVILGPNHKVPLRAIAMPSAAAFRTPLGEVPVDREALGALDGLPYCITDDEAHAAEHALEVMLPFLQVVLDDFTIVPLVVGQVPGAKVAEVLDRLWGGPETLIIVSSDLSHYLSGADAQRTDRDTARIIERLAVGELGGERACGFHPLSGLLLEAESRDLRLTRLDLRHSGDTAGSMDKVVGYGAWALEYAFGARISDQSRAALHALARRAVIDGAGGGGPPEVPDEDLPTHLQTLGASFTTITVDGRFRGCRGTIEPVRSLAGDVARNAYLSAFEDSRVPPLTRDEAERAEIGISVLSHPHAIECAGEAELLAALNPDQDGLILSEQRRRALFLPKVWSDLPDPRDFVRELKRKGGWPADYWSADMRVERFSAEYF